nr:TIGR02996 domain-containing protein [Kofleriaceae bacterium]
MADLMAIVSKAVFEKAAGKAPKLGTKLGMDRYVSANKALEPLGDRGRLFLVTVRPPNEALWLVGILEGPKFDGAQWTSKPSATPITDISGLRKKLKFESGAGITAAAGALGMSLQTPRKLTAADVALLDAAGGNGAASASDDAGDARPGGGRAANIVESTGGKSDALLAAVLDNPDDDDARRVYADALAQRNDPRGELVTLELALAGPLSIRRRDLMHARRAELLKQHGQTWFPYKVKFRTNRGFIWSVEGTLAQLGAATEVFANEPVIEVIARDANPATLGKAPWLARIRRLVVRGGIGDDGFGTLIAAKNVAALRELNVMNNDLSGEALGELGDRLPACTSLVLTANQLGDVSGLAEWAHVANLEKLYLSHCELDDIAPLLARPMPNLAKLCLSGNDLGDGVATAIAKAAAKLPALKRLELVETGVKLAGVKTLMSSKLGPQLHLDVRKTGIDADAVATYGGRVSAS